jgi:short chain dehydrogenase
VSDPCTLVLVLSLPYNCQRGNKTKEQNKGIEIGCLRRCLINSRQQSVVDYRPDVLRTLLTYPRERLHPNCRRICPWAYPIKKGQTKIFLHTLNPPTITNAVQLDMEPSEPSKSQSKGVAFVTGAARGIGCAIALRLADDGFDVAVNDLPNTPELVKVVKEIEAKGRRAIAMPGDVSNESVVTDMIQQTVRELGSLDVVRRKKKRVYSGCSPPGPAGWFPVC